jgi:hypothetical protein
MCYCYKYPRVHPRVSTLISTFFKFLKEKNMNVHSNPNTLIPAWMGKIEAVSVKKLCRVVKSRSFLGIDFSLRKNCIRGSSVLKRMPKKHSSVLLGEEDWTFLMKNQDLIPPSWKKLNRIIFFGKKTQGYAPSLVWDKANSLWIFSKFDIWTVMDKSFHYAIRS